MSHFFQVECDMLPGLAEAGEAGDASHARAPPRPVRVVVFPYLSEQRSSGDKSPRRATGEPLHHRLRTAFKATFGPTVALDICSTDDAANNASDFDDFLTYAWPRLKKVNVLVTHRNFLANEILARAQLSPQSFIPNAAVVHLVVTEQPSCIVKEIYFVRHCASHNNVAHVGSIRLTTCASVTALRRLAPELARRAGNEVLYGSSALPRAVLSAIALQRDVDAATLEAVRRAFEQPAAPAEAISAYVGANVCRGASGDEQDYCRGKQGTFRLS